MVRAAVDIARVQELSMSVVSWSQRIAESPRFANFITAFILIAGVMVGIETNAAFADRHRGFLEVLDTVVLSVFAAEIVLRMAATWPRPWRYFRDPWNCFDFVIVVGALMPFIASYALLLRLFRLLRVLRLVRTLPRLRRLVQGLLYALPSMGYVLVLLFMLFYIYGCAGVFFFGDVAAEQFGSLPKALWSLFKLVTLENWPDTYEAVESKGLLATFYFISFILLGTMVMLNLVIGIIVQGMEEAKHPSQDEKGRDIPLRTELAALQEDLSSLSSRTNRVAQLLEQAEIKEARAAHPEAKVA
jgi:voltage-gated sodium channel